MFVVIQKWNVFIAIQNWMFLVLGCPQYLTLGHSSSSYPKHSTLGDVSSSYPEHLTLEDASSSYLEHSTLGDLKSTISVKS